MERNLLNSDYTCEENLAKQAFGPGGSVRLDGEGIRYADDRCVRLVLLGMSPLAEALAIEALKTAHFPNYIRDHSLRSRITWIAPEAFGKGKDFIARHRSLMDESFWCFTDPASGVMETHRPRSEGRLEDFVDFEWEFIEAGYREPLIKERIVRWNRSPRWTMTVAFAAEAASENSEARAFLESALEGIPVFVAPESCPRNPRLPLEDIGMLVNALYQKTLETKCPPREVDMDLARRLWASLPHQLRRNSMDAVMNLEAKMRSFNLDGGNPDAFDTLPREELALLAEVEHNRWSVVTLLSGKRPASREEQAYIEQDIRLKDEYRKQGIHYDLRAFSDLRPDAAGIPVAVYDEAMVRGIPLMVRYLKEMTE